MSQSTEEIDALISALDDVIERAQDLRDALHAEAHPPPPLVHGTLAHAFVSAFEDEAIERFNRQRHQLLRLVYPPGTSRTTR